MKSKAKIKCPHCGADYTHLHLDTLIKVSATINEDGTFETTYLDATEVVNRMMGNTIDDFEFFCDECGDVMKATFEFEQFAPAKEMK